MGFDTDGFHRPLELGGIFIDQPTKHGWTNYTLDNGLSPDGYNRFQRYVDQGYPIELLSNGYFRVWTHPSRQITEREARDLTGLELSIEQSLRRVDVFLRNWEHAAYMGVRDNLGSVVDGSEVGGFAKRVTHLFKPIHITAYPGQHVVIETREHVRAVLKAIYENYLLKRKTLSFDSPSNRPKITPTRILIYPQSR